MGDKKRIVERFGLLLCIVMLSSIPEAKTYKPFVLKKLLLCKPCFLISNYWLNKISYSQLLEGLEVCFFRSDLVGGGETKEKEEGRRRSCQDRRGT